MSSSSNEKNNISWTIVATILIPVTVLVISYVTSEIQNKTGLSLLVYGTILVIIVLLLSLFYIYILERISLNEINNSINRLSLLIDRHTAQGNLSGLYTLEQVVRYEQSVNAKEIWLISADLSEELSDGPFAETVGNNIDVGVKYVYFTPKSQKIYARVESIRKHHVNKKFKIFYLPESFFFLTKRLDIVIYNPLERSQERSGFLGLPIKQENANEGDHYHISIDNDFIEVIVSELLPLIRPEHTNAS